MDYEEIKTLAETGQTVKVPDIDDDNDGEYDKWQLSEVTRITRDLLKLFTDNDFAIPELFVVKQFIGGSVFSNSYLKVTLIVI